MAIEVVLPTLHPDQVKAYRLPGRFKAIRCGRRWGKTALALVVACDAAIKRQAVGIFAPDYKILAETFNEMAEILAPVKRASSKVEGIFRTTTGGRVDFWTLENERAGRSRKYHKVIIDEAAFTKPNMMDVWEKAIKPTLLDYHGSALVLSNTSGDNPENFFWQICNVKKHGFVEYHAPTHRNPHLPAADLAKLKEQYHPLIYRQEFLAEFVDFSGDAFFDKEKLLIDGQPVDVPPHCDAVFAVIDCAAKTGREHDGTAVVYCARSMHTGHPLVILDWDYVQIEGDLLDVWLKTVFVRLEDLARQCKARAGSAGVWIEDASTGIVLLQRAARERWPAHPIDGKLTSLGKDERAISVSSQYHQGKVKISRPAHDKVSIFKGASRNHLLAQVTGFRIGDKAAATRADDLLDAFVYAIAVTLGTAEGFG